MPRTWEEQLKKKFVAEYGNKKGTLLAEKYAMLFPNSYQDENQVAVAVKDIAYIEKLSKDNPLELAFTFSSTQGLHLRLYQWQKPSALSDVLPVFENFDLRTDNEHPYEISLDKNQCIWIIDFAVQYAKENKSIEESTELFRDAFIQVYSGLAENDGFNKLVLGAGLTWREVMIFRLYAKYLRQVLFRFSQSYIEKALICHADIAKELINLFKSLHDPLHASKAKKAAAQIEERILKALDGVSSLDEDRIIRCLLNLIKETLRTNFFRLDEAGKVKQYVSVKLNSRNIPELPLPLPLFEIFVYSPRFEAIHLRNALVARGGIRWSDRPEDFRTEVLGLMKAQVVKNAVIVPSGAKGGFVLKALPANASGEQRRAEVIQCYSDFIRGLLDITDNIVNNKFTSPPQVVCYDETDPYLVVAADKGTATFSDLANQISREYAFWLDDAFASGGETGYDHKKMGITAKGAWESIKRHFRELDIDALTSNITVVGIGDMSGDVFGNGMIYSKHLKLVAAFDHRHIFIDPVPDPEVSYYERLRLFKLPASSWQDYNAKIISKGGGVFARSLKSIPISREMQKALAITASALTPNELIQAILRAPVDLLYNGGIGTYVKASTQSQDEVGDRTNDYCRVNGNELRCKVVGEGGNLGFTQLGRVEYALIGGLINTDFIDNSAGVDCSDHEVNLKILLDTQVQNDKLKWKKRNEIMASLTDEVSELVLKDNYNQALVMSVAAKMAKEQINLYSDYIRELNSLGVLNRRVEFLPDEKQLTERKTANEGLTRPELAVLLTYSKIYIKEEILKSSLPEDPFLKRSIDTAFPPMIRKKYAEQMQSHRLHREIIATQLSNEVVNAMGIIFVYRLHIETGATVDEIVRAQKVASRVFDAPVLRQIIESLDFKISINDQYEMLHNLHNLINLACRWFLHSKHLSEDLEAVIEHFSVRVKKLEAMIPDLMSGMTRDYLISLTEKFEKAGLSKEMARRIAAYRAIYTSLNIIEVSTENHFDLESTARTYLAAGEHMHLVWFRDQIATDAREGHWNILARLTLRDELDIAQRLLTVAVMNQNKREKDTNKLIVKWSERNTRALKRWERVLNMLQSTANLEYTMFFIAVRELIGLIVSSH